jgi:hypothetical protein
VDKKRIREIIIFAVVFMAYNVLVFAIPFSRNANFVIAYLFALLSIFALAASYYYSFIKTKSLTNLVFSFPIFHIGLFYAITQIIISTLFMILASFFDFPIWVEVVPCVLLLSAAVIKALAIDIAKDKIVEVQQGNQVNTAFMRSLQIDLEVLASRATNEVVKAKLAKSSEVARYSDPVSNDALAEVEANMQLVFDRIKTGISAGKDDLGFLIDELDNLLSERNKRCKMLKSSKSS